MTIMSVTKPRYDFYQTDTAVNLSVFVKGLTESDVDCRFGEHSVSSLIGDEADVTGSSCPISLLSILILQLSLSLKPATAPEPQALELQLFDEIDPSNSAYKILSTKVDVVLQKRNPGRRWTQLEAIAGGSGEFAAAALRLG
jgi:suppressor of G2 allele of SKP1